MDSTIRQPILCLQLHLLPNREQMLLFYAQCSTKRLCVKTSILNCFFFLSVYLTHTTPSNYGNCDKNSWCSTFS